jgi:hypothetical protein
MDQPYLVLLDKREEKPDVKPDEEQDDNSNT